MPVVVASFDFGGEPEHPVLDVLADAREAVLEALLAFYDLPVAEVTEVTRLGVTVLLDEEALQDRREAEL